ncbi:PilW family protein [Pseudomonas otitidis]|uniref:PilW family protein n=1 Tax=Metapseudomonas otitidis TaxID=319939 RepID=UPI0008DED230|nr:PilW family protein [Pseudomonas otitidis]MDI6526069.1 PilW family protein [Pseudomonas otitidis]SFA66244.1 type IV pilus assembly protein PilW [Pseudomonas otitidis]
MKFHSQKGLSLVELMVVLVISGFLIVGVTQIYFANKVNYIAQQSVGEVQDNSRFAARVLEQQFMKAGYKTLPQDSREMAFPSRAAQGGCPAFAAGQVVGLLTSGKGVCLRYQRRVAGELDCLGAPISTNAAIVTKIELNGDGDLLCSAQSGTAQALVSGVSDIQFTFGVDLNSDRVADSFVSSPSAGTVVAVRVALLQRSDNSSVALENQKYNFPLSSAVAVTAPDGRIYKSTQNTFTVRSYAQ